MGTKDQNAYIHFPQVITDRTFTISHSKRLQTFILQKLHNTSHISP